MKNYTQFKEEERVEIFELRQFGHGIRSSTRILNKDNGTVSRKFARN